jgi:hypothetical protein
MSYDAVDSGIDYRLSPSDTKQLLPLHPEEKSAAAG